MSPTSQEEEDEAAAIDDKARRARRVSAKIKNNESSDLEITGVRQVNENDSKQGQAYMRGISASNQNG